ncbi:MAG: NUDIX hydrolase [Muribaculaceae bacterium]|nr:NUDIX hydrolase [Muribaculaceae bacterium]MDE6554050.1 NUDIX hydrolase [Muribaculaceae bacterium]
MNYYKEHARHYVGVDCVIFGLHEGKLNILLIKRRMMPGKGQWSLMGGFVEENESVDDAAKRVLHQLTGLEDVYMDQVGTFGAIDRDPGARVISVAYCALLNFDDQDHQRVTDNDAHWVPLEEMPQLYFDHPQIVAKALEYLRLQVNRKPLVFQFLPELFTLSQLQSVYEAILGEKLDKRNFRKRILDEGILEKTDLIDKSGSKRGATLYRLKIKD